MKQAKRERDAATSSLTLLPEPEAEMSKKMKQAKAEGEEAGYAITLLPEPMIHHIQSFLTRKDAARTSCISKSWYDAWLTRPTLSFDESDFQNKGGFGALEKFSTETMERYRDMNLRIESFSLRTQSSADEFVSLGEKLTADAIKIGATDLNIDTQSFPTPFVLPPEVLGSETLTRLCLHKGTIADGNVIRCSRLKSLTLYLVRLGSGCDDYILRDIICRCTWIEELSITSICIRRLIILSEFNLHKLMRLYLRGAEIGEWFFSNLASGCPCLKDLTLVNCIGYTRIRIASTSLEHISFVKQKGALEGEFDVPNIRKFVYSGEGSPPSVRFQACSREWESDISLRWNYKYKPSGTFLSLKRNMLAKLKGSRISLTITSNFMPEDWKEMMMMDSEIEDVVVVENLRINASPYSSFLVLGLFSVCSPTATIIADRYPVTTNLFQTCEAVNQDLTTLNLTTQYNQMVQFYDKVAGERRFIKPPAVAGAVDDSTIRNIRVHLIRTPTTSSH